MHKDNIIKFQSNRYSVPLGTYKPNGDNTVRIRIVEDQLIIKKNHGEEPLAVHRLSKGKGQLIKNANHGRDRLKGIAAYMETVKDSFEDGEKIQLFLDEIYHRYPRYIRDQLKILQKTVKEFRTHIQSALDICINKGLWSANDFRDVAKHLAGIQIREEPILHNGSSSASQYYKEKATVRELHGYLKILGSA